MLRALKSKTSSNNSDLLHSNLFNKTLLEFAKQMQIIAPNKDNSNLFMKLQCVINIHPTKIIELFIINILPDKDKIELDNDDYFLNKQYDSTEDETIGVKKEDSITFIYELKKIWVTLSIQDKSIIITYLKILCTHSLNFLINTNKI
jgi:hypothetical protein